MLVRCLADISGPFYDPTLPFRNWSSLPFDQLDRPTPPYVDRARLERGIERASSQLFALHAQGYTGIVIDNLAHLTTFDAAPIPVYTRASPFRRRALSYREAFGRLFATAHSLGMEVFVTADMQWATPPLRAYVGELEPENLRLAEVNRWALKELFGAFPAVSGLVMRVGEAGGAHNLGESYTGHMMYTDVASLRGLLRTLLPVCERHGRQLILRTWSIGIGELGDLIWNRERYQAVFAGFDSPALVASIKYGPGDFFRLLPENPTLGLPGPRQWVELQNRREYELLGVVPSSIADLHQSIIQRAAANQQIDGVWAWNATGGWGGGTATLGANGWSFWTELSSALTAGLVRQPNLDTHSFVTEWCSQRFGSVLGAAVAAAYLESAELIEQAWYPGRTAHSARPLGRLYMPPLLWVWWTAPTASLPIWAYLVAATDDWLGHSVQSANAVARARWHAERLAALATAAPQAAELARSLAYFADALAVMHAIRTCLGPLFLAAAKGQRRTWAKHVITSRTTLLMLQAYRRRWAGNTAYPPLLLDEVESFLTALERAPWAIWPLARLSALIIAQALRSSELPRRRLLSPTRRYAIAAGAALLAAELLRRRPGALSLAGIVASLLLASPLRQRAIRAALPWVSRRAYLLPTVFFDTGPGISQWA